MELNLEGKDYSKMTYLQLKKESNENDKLRNVGDYVDWYDKQMIINRYLSVFDYNGKLLEVGDIVVHVFGRGLRTSVIEEIIEFVPGSSNNPNIRMIGLKKPICHLLCIK